MTKTPASPAEKLIADFYDNALISFYTSAVDGTPCVEVREAAGRLRSSTVTDLAASIMSFKRANARKTKAAA